MYPSVALFAAALFWGNVLAQGDMNACAKGCVVGIFNDPSRLGCKPEDKNCACHSGDNLKFGVRDCITQACNLSGAQLDEQISMSDTYTNELCQPFTGAPPATTAPPAAGAAAPPATTAPPAPAPAASTADPTKTDPASPPEAKDPPASNEPATGTQTGATSAATGTQAGATSAATSQPTTGASAASADTPSGTVNASSAASTHGAGAAASTASPTSSGSAGKEEKESSEEGLSVAAKAGIGAGAGVVVVMAAITLCCIMMRRRRDARNAAKGPTRPTRSPLPCNISKPVAGGRHYAEDVESPAALNFPFPATAAVNEKSSPPTSREDHYSVHGNRYEDMLPRTQPRTMI
ncbi:extracellular membrane protein- CFEM domain-containing protein [Apiospora rasikravindrae]|uniref:Extracellular membrane protein- CFEM domain-containing protein n=1 Tax=Apiospora rasikravindrae TaxID=990691 RepID=A0ABR1TC77_9PEZI